MNIRFLEREMRRNALDEKGLHLDACYLASIKGQYPGLWEQFKHLIAVAEKIADGEDEDEC